MDKRIVNRILKLLLGGYLKRICNMECMCEGMESIEPPYILLGNHTNFFDPFIVSYCIKDHVCFVASDEYFRNALLRGLLKIVGAIPKAKFISDSSAVREIIRLKEQKAAIGIYPEGTRTWDGRTAPLLYATSRLIKSLNIPVVTALTTGGYLSFPRWAGKRRKGKMFLDIKVLLSKQDVENMKAEDINKAIEDSLNHNENVWQKEKMIRFKGSRLAENLELYLHTCPKCLKTGYLKSDDDIFECKNCGYALRYNEYGFFENIIHTESDNKSGIIFDNVGDWGVWQQKRFEGVMEEWLAGDTSKPILEQINTEVYIGGWRRRNFIRRNKGVLTLVDGKLVFNGHKGIMEFDPKYMVGLVINHKNKLDFFYKDRKLYRMKFHNNIISGFLWSEALKIMKRRRRNGRKLDADN
jgi:1-acyl-sn-glycerol-3-phosphate acyltransferase